MHLPNLTITSKLVNLLITAINGRPIMFPLYLQIFRDADDAVYDLNGRVLLGERITVEVKCFNIDYHS